MELTLRIGSQFWALTLRSYLAPLGNFCLISGVFLTYFWAYWGPWAILELKLRRKRVGNGETFICIVKFDSWVEKVAA